MLALSAAVLAPSSSSPSSGRTAISVVRGDVQIGRSQVQRNGTLDGAVRAFGPPSSLRLSRYQTCVARWRELGLRITFYNLGGWGMLGDRRVARAQRLGAELPRHRRRGRDAYAIYRKDRRIGTARGPVAIAVAAYKLVLE
jgi:hypothetical protein